MSRLVSRSAVPAVILGLAACGTVTPTFRPRAGNGGTYPTTTADVGVPAGRTAGRDTTFLGRPRDRATPIPSDRGQLDVRRVCRSGSFPRGYLAVGYEGSSSDCPRAISGADSVATVAIVVRYVDAPIGTRLDMCADQAIPSGWNPVSDEGPGDPGACPGATRKGDTVQRIRRDY